MAVSLSQWLASKGMSQSRFAELIGASQGEVSRYVSGERTPLAPTAVAIERETGGAVPVESWGRRPRRRRGGSRRRAS